MSAETAIVAYLAASGRVTALVSSRIYPVMAPADGALPSVVYQRISGPRELLHDGPSGQSEARLQLSVTAERYATCKEVIQALRMALDGQKGRAPDAETTRVLEIGVENEQDGWNVNTERYTVRLDVYVRYVEPVK